MDMSFGTSIALSEIILHACQSIIQSSTWHQLLCSYQFPWFPSLYIRGTNTSLLPVKAACGLVSETKCRGMFIFLFKQALFLCSNMADIIIYSEYPLWFSLIVCSTLSFHINSQLFVNSLKVYYTNLLQIPLHTKELLLNVEIYIYIIVKYHLLIC
jgi:hypothetical protein